MIGTPQTKRMKEKGDSIMKTKENPARMLWQLFKATFLLSAFTFGGGFVIVSLMKKKFVEELKWLEEDEMLDITAITRSSPGPLPVNASVIIGYRMQGIPGSLAAVLGTILPPMFVISLICVFYTEFRQNLYIAAALQVMRAGVAAVILDVTWNLAKNVWNSHSVFYTSLMVLSFCGAYFFGVSAMIIILICLVIGITEAVLTSYKKKGVTGNESFN